MQTVLTRTPGSPQTGTLIACRDLALGMLTESLDDFFQGLEETFFQLAETTTERSLRDQYFDARVEARTKKDAIVAAFKQQFLASFEASLQPRGARGESAFYQVNLTPDALSLVANEEYETSLTLSSISNALQQKSGETLTHLEQRLASLLPDHRDSHDNGNSFSPLSPKVICEAFLTACQQLDSGLAARLVALRTFEVELSGRVAGVYQQLNQYLIQQNVPLPAIARRAGSRSTPSQAHQAGVSGLAAQDGMTGGQGAGGESALASMLRPELVTHLNQLFSSDTPQPQRALRPDWFNFLDHLQQDALGSVQDMSLHPENLLALLRGSRWTQELDRLDTMTVELVALLFDRLFEDDRLSNAAKGLLARLQVPALKAAMLDTRFFSDKAHPARRLIDRLADAGLEWQGEPAADDPQLCKFVEVIADVARSFTDDTAVFQSALDALDQWLDAERAVIDAAISDQADALLAGEISELANATAQALIEQKLSTEHPPVVIAFVQEHWRAALVAAYGVEGEAASLFVERLAVIDQLLWSVAPKVRPEDRLQLVNTLPALLSKLEAGIREIGVGDATRKSFFSELVQLHAGAIRQGLKLALQVQATPAALAVPVVGASIPTVEPVVAQEGVVAPVQEAMSQLGAEAPSVLMAEPFGGDASAPNVASSAALEPQSQVPERGEWVEWREGDALPRRLRVSWISPQGTRFLLTSRGDKGLTLMRHEIEAYLASGVLSRLKLGDGVTEDAFAQLREALAV
ncbi:hypothetical protein JHS3_10460 [Jeongeupia sp. HS-3]|uniref:DUF1631 family protein n=1 Tax=Jeongeupia sp. HS-3 TaxID=1009682 RepID=UPI0018A6459E|nr:DUF1631 family protein [Jeongeupia sp. HS-3]BCL75310.1 hypothetical protein JHS3_10460 [Jeongeupia sp. HS-3]